ncbi:MAG: TetR/AcrR family transcriptional regulator [Clostridiales bacterium]|jgi:AcrR family transcriptional regulator|nr:TetR/AcrR family transcriptional regulator [Clostridiales bacterium]
MKEVKEDRRVKYTKMALKESFIRLLTQKDISQITIKEICENADINRATFYAHYSDQYDLLRKIENELLDNISAQLSGYEKAGIAPWESDWHNTVDMVEKIFDYIRENALLCRLLLNDRGDLHFQKRIMMLVYDEIIENLIKKGGITKQEAEYIYAFAITGCVGAIQKWFDNDLSDSARAMAELLVRAFYKLTMPM